MHQEDTFWKCFLLFRMKTIIIHCTSETPKILLSGKNIYCRRLKTVTRRRRLSGPKNDEVDDQFRMLYKKELHTALGHNELYRILAGTFLKNVPLEYPKWRWEDDIES